MTLLSSVFAASALAISGADRLAMADRLFNRGDYKAAQAEYAALKGASDVDVAELAYRALATANALGEKALLRTDAAAFLKTYPTHTRADRVRLMCALAGTKAERAAELKALDRDDVAKEIRAEALYWLGDASGDATAFERCAKVDPSGRFAGYAKVAHATALVNDADAKKRRLGVAELMDVVYGKDPKLAQDALYLAAATSYRESKWGECETLAKRYQKLYPNDARAKDVTRLAALAALNEGSYAAALALATDEKDDTLLYVKVLASDRLGNRADAQRLAQQYLDAFPQGSCRAAMTLQCARYAFDDAVKTDNATNILVAARRCADLSKGAADRLRLGWAEEKAGQPERAEETYAAVARDFPKTANAADALYRRALSLIRREQWAAAELSLAEALSCKTLDKERAAAATYWRGMSANRLGHAEEAARFLNEALAAGLTLDEQREARLLLADFDLAAGKRDEAVKAYAALVRDGAVTRMSAAKTLQVGRLLAGEDARICAKALIANGAAEWRQAGYALLGDIEEQAENYVAAADAYEKCFAEKCTTEVLAAVSVKLGVYQFKEGDLAAAEKTLKSAIELNGASAENRATAYLTLAKVALQRDDRESAKGYATYVATLFEKTKAAAEAKEILK